MRLLLALSILFLFQSCDTSETLTLSGTIPGAQDGSKVYFQKISQNNQPFDVDTTEIKGGKFSFEIAKSKESQLGLINFRNLNSTHIFFYDDKDIKGTFDLNKPFDAPFKGGRDNDLWLKYRDKIQEFDDKKRENLEAMQEAQRAMSNQDMIRLQTEAAILANEEQVFKKEFIDKNINSLSAMLVLNEMITKREVNIREVEAYLAKRDPKLFDNVFNRQIDVNSKTLRIPHVGDIAPEFSGPDPEGNIISLSETKGKVTLVDFWASWCRPCRLENPNIVRVYNQYKDQGFTVISISLDRPGHKAQWVKAIEDDKMEDWHHISSLMFWQDPIAQLYGVSSIPKAYLLDETGKIVATELRGPALGQKVGELLRNN